MQAKLQALIDLLGQAPYTRDGWSVALNVTVLFTILVLSMHAPGTSLYSLPWWAVIAECVITVVVMAYFAFCFLAWLGLERERKAAIIAANRETNRTWKNSLYFHIAAVVAVSLYFSISVFSLQEALPDLVLVDGVSSTEALPGYIGNLTVFGYGYEIAEYVFGAAVEVAQPNPKYFWFWAYSNIYSLYFGCVLLKVLWDAAKRMLLTRLGWDSAG